MEEGVRTLVTLPMTGKQEGMTTDKPKPGPRSHDGACEPKGDNKNRTPDRTPVLLVSANLGSFSPGLLQS